MNRLDELRIKWKIATPEERKVIEDEALLLKGETQYQCYYQSDVDDPETRCTERQAGCWCSDEHRTAWQESNYIDTRDRGEHKLSIAEIQDRLRHMGRHKSL